MKILNNSINYIIINYSWIDTMNIYYIIYWKLTCLYNVFFIFPTFLILKRKKDKKIDNIA